MAWIKVFSEIWESWKVPALCGALKISEAQAVGHLVSLWSFTERNAWKNGDLEKWGALGVARAARWEGPPEDFVKAMREATFFNKDSLIVHEWTEHQASMVHDRESRRQAKSPRDTAQIPRTPRANTAPDKSRVDKREREEGEVRENNNKGEADPPTLSEVREYRETEHLKADPDKFHFYQASKGWPGLVDWKAAFRYWDRTEFSDKTPAPAAQTGAPRVNPADAHYAAMEETEKHNLWHEAHLPKGKCLFCGAVIKSPSICTCPRYSAAFKKKFGFKETTI